MIHERFKRRSAPRRLTYSVAGVDRSARKKSRDAITSRILGDSKRYAFGKPLRLPFGLVYPAAYSDGRLYYDLQIEGVGTKTLLAEISGDYESIGIDAVAMAVNDVIRSGASPLLLSDAIHLANSDRLRIKQLISGVRAGARLSKCTLASGETGNVLELLHPALKSKSPPFDLIVSCLGIANKSELIRGAISPGDSVVGLWSSGIHSNGLTLARKVLLDSWGGKFGPWAVPVTLRRPIVEELLEPTRIYVQALVEARKAADLKAAIHITGDGFGKFKRFLNWQIRFKRPDRRIGFRFEGLREMPEIFRLVYETSRAMRTPISMTEMFKTFNMGYGFAIILDPREVNAALESLNKQVKAEVIGHVTSEPRISVSGKDLERTLIL
ncbi:MAG: AIR synthase-related protein [Nitrososphaerales archaeon]